MPLYEYRCLSCGETFDRLLAMSASEHGQSCPVCGSDSCRRLLSMFAVKVAGSSAPAGKSCSSCTKSLCASC